MDLNPGSMIGTYNPASITYSDPKSRVQDVDSKSGSQRLSKEYMYNKIVDPQK